MKIIRVIKGNIMPKIAEGQRKQLPNLQIHPVGLICPSSEK